MHLDQIREARQSTIHRGLAIYFSSMEQEPMDLLKVPFVEYVGIRRIDKSTVALDLMETVHNHLGAVCAGAQYTLAETASANALQVLFPELVGTTIPVIRETKIKFRKQAMSGVRASASIPEDEIQAFQDRYRKSGRGLIQVAVELRDEEDEVTCTGRYTWYIQRIEG